MAVRNMDAIQRQGNMIAEQKRNERQMREENFWKRVDMIKACHDDAIDFVDTVDALAKNGLRGKFDEWMKQQNVKYEGYRQLIRVCCLCGSKESALVGYYPKKDDVHFGWNGYGMCESYDVSVPSQNADYVIHSRLSQNNYDEGLTMMATRLQPFLNAFFKWVETI